MTPQALPEFKSTLTPIMVAYHEAGHAAAALALGYPIARLGQYEIILAAPLASPHHEALIALAGPIAMATQMDVPLNQTLPLSYNDFERAIPLVGHNQAALTAAIGEAATLVYDHWQTVEMLARQLQRDDNLFDVRSGISRYRG